MRHRLLAFSGFVPLKHRPPLPPRWQLYCVIAFLAPPVLLQLIPAHEVPYRDLVWLVTLVPAFLLSLQYGMRGAVAGLLMGTVLFTAIQFLVAAKLDAEDWRVTVPIYIAYSAIAISVGWLSEQLHLFYERAIVGERITVITQVAIAMRHEVNNALATLLAETQLLETSDHFKSPEDRVSLRQIGEMARRVHVAVEKLTTLTAPPPVTEYALGATMIDLERIPSAPPPATG